MDAQRVSFAILGIGASLLLTPPIKASAAPAWQFHLEEATIADVHRAIRAKQITAVQLVNLYFKRIEAYNGTCVKGDIDPATGLMLGELTPIENAGQVNAYMTLNIRGKRSKTDAADNDANLSDALEVARAQDAYFARTGQFVGPLHGIPLAIKDNYDTIDMRTTAGAAAEYANDKPPKDATMVAKLRAAGAIILEARSRRIERGFGRRGRGEPRHLRVGHRHRRVGAQSFIRQRPRRHGRDAGAGKPRRHCPVVILARPRRTDVPHRGGHRRGA